MTDISDGGPEGELEPGSERTSFFDAPEWRRRTVAIDITQSGHLKLEAVIVSRRWAPHRAVKRLVAAAPGYWLERALRRLAGRKLRQRIEYRQGSLRVPSALVFDGDEMAPESVLAVALQGWQEDFGRDRIWDVMLLGPDRDLVVGHKSYDEAHDLAIKLSEVLGVPLKESSVVGGSTTAASASMSVRDMRYDAPRPDGWRHLT